LVNGTGVPLADLFYLKFYRLKRTGKRDEIYLATKFGFVFDGERVINGTPEHARLSVEKSLKRLGVSSIDLYYLHVRVFILGVMVI
jgi:diketogulonate reductase-like aldo/keto reductase